MFVGDARSLPRSEVLERCSTRVASGLTCKHQTRLERLRRHKHTNVLVLFVIYLGRLQTVLERPHRDKHSSLLRTLIIYGRKMTYSPSYEFFIKLDHFVIENVFLH
jgi:hypothetical protein